MSQLNNIERTLGELMGEVRGINARLDRQNGSIRDCANKINMLETFRDTMVGKISIISAIFGLIGAGVLAVFNYFIKR